MDNNNNNPQSPQHTQSASGPPPQSIPLRNLQRPPDETNPNYGGQHYGGQPGDGQSGPASSQQYQHPQDGGAEQWRTSPTSAQMTSNPPGISTYWADPYTPYNDAGGDGGDSPIDHVALQFALPPDLGPQQPLPGGPQDRATLSTPYGPPAPYYEAVADSDSFEDSDRVPLKPAAQPMSGLEPPDEDQRRDSFQTVSDLDNSPARNRNTQMLGFDLEPGFGSNRHRSFGNSLSPEGRRRSRSPTATGALSRAGSIVRAMSQRVVMISGEGDLIDQQARRDRSRSSSPNGLRQHHLSAPMLEGTAYPSQTFQGTPAEKKGDSEYVISEEPPPPFIHRRNRPNPLKGNSLGIFSPENPVRKWLCDVLVSHWTEPIILILIILQVVLLAIEASPNVFRPGNERPDRWGSTRIDWAIFGLFAVFTLELVARIIVSGLVVNAPEYAAADPKRGVRQKVAEQYRQIFKPQRQKSVKGQQLPVDFTPTFARSFTVLQGQALPETVQEQQRLQLARRAFLRHGFNRLDFVAVVSFWISFVLGVTGLETRHHLYLFRMLSCLRILRLLAITKGNAVSPHPPKCLSLSC